MAVGFISVYFLFYSIIFRLINADCDVDRKLRHKGIEVYEIMDDGYDDAKFQYGSTVLDHSEDVSPTLIAYATNAEEVQTIVKFVNGCDNIKTISIRSGGHQKSGLSSCKGNCLQLDVSNIKTFKILDEDYGVGNSYNENINNNKVLNKLKKRALIRVGTGLSYSELYEILLQYGINFVGGTCEDVFVGGNYQSSGHSAWSQSFGPGLDWIISFRIVLADGTLLTVNPKDDNTGIYIKELYRANLGGSPGAFGVIIDYNVEVFYDTNFPNAAVSFTYYLYSEETMKAILLEYNKLIKDDSFRDNADFGNGAILILSRFDEGPEEIKQIAEAAGVDHIIIVAFHYLGIQTGLSLFENPIYTNYINARLRNPNYNQALNPIAPFDVEITPSQRNYLFSTDWLYWDTGFASQLSSNDFSDEYYSKWADGINSLIKDGYIITATTYVAYGATFQTNDPYNIYTAHPFRDTRVFTDVWNRVKPDSNNYDYLVKNGQDKIEKIFKELNELLPEIDQGRKFQANTWGDTNIDNVWRDYFESLVSYIRLRIVKYKVDPNNIFNTPFTINPIITSWSS